MQAIAQSVPQSVVRSCVESNGRRMRAVWTAFALASALAFIPSLAASAANPIPRTGWSLVYADSQELVGENGAAVNAFDGNASSFWHTQWYQGNPPPPNEIQINLGAAYSISGFRYLPRQDADINGTIAQYEFYVSATGPPFNWVRVANGTFATSKTEKEVAFASVTGQYVRLRALSEVNGKAWTAAAEINVLGLLLPP